MIVRFAGALPCAALCFVSLVATASAAIITIVNADDPGEGLNDPALAVPVGANSGITLGEQRLLALQYAAGLWGDVLASNVEILVEARFNPLGGTTTNAPLGFAGPSTVHKGFPGAPLAATFYVAALSNSLAGSDLNPGGPDLNATFNSDVDGLDVLGPIDFYYGFDRLAGPHVDFVSVALHELAHGLGFLTLTNLQSGAKRACAESESGCNDAYLLGLVDDSFIPSAVAELDNADRVDAFIDGPDLLWGGANVVATSTGLTGGVRGDGRVEVFAPKPVVLGSSVSHFSTSISPNQLMEPSYVGPNHDLALTTALFTDLGWRLASETTTTSTSSTTMPSATCGDANEDGEIKASDALMALRTAVGDSDCPATRCDADSSGAVTASDAQRILKYAVGDDVELSCP